MTVSYAALYYAYVTVMVSPSAFCLNDLKHSNIEMHNMQAY